MQNIIIKRTAGNAASSNAATLTPTAIAYIVNNSRALRALPRREPAPVQVPLVRAA